MHQPSPEVLGTGDNGINVCVCLGGEGGGEEAAPAGPRSCVWPSCPCETSDAHQRPRGHNCRRKPTPSSSSDAFPAVACRRGGGSVDKGEAAAIGGGPGGGVGVGIAGRAGRMATDLEGAPTFIS